MLTLDKIKKVNIPASLWRANNIANSTVAPYNDSVNFYDAVVVIIDELANSSTTNLGALQEEDTTTITSSTGDDVIVLAANDTRSGVMSSDQATFLDALTTLAGVTPGDADLGSFTGSTITSDATIKVALQDLETALEAVTGESSQDAVGNILLDSSTINFTYDDATPSISAIVIDSSITFAKMQNINTARLLGRSTASTGVIEELTIGSGLSLSGGVLSNTGGSGTVTSVAASVPGTLLQISGSPVTTSGTLAITLATQSANTVFAGATSGTATPTFRALVADDIPSLTVSKLSDFEEAVDDRVATLLVEGTGITLTYDDGSDTLTIDATSTNYTDEEAQDAVGTILLDSTTIDFTYNDGTPSITAGVKSNSVANSLLTSGTGGIYKGSGTIASGAAAKVTASSTFRINYNSDDAAVIVDDLDESSTVFSNSGDSYVYVNNDTVEITSIGGLILPKLTTAERDALTPVSGTVIYNTTSNKLNFYNGATWEVVTSA